MVRALAHCLSRNKFVLTGLQSVCAFFVLQCIRLNNQRIADADGIHFAFICIFIWPIWYETMCGWSGVALRVFSSSQNKNNKSEEQISFKLMYERQEK